MNLPLRQLEKDIAALPEKSISVREKWREVKAVARREVLERFAPTSPGVFLFYPGHRQILPKLRAFIDHVKSRSAANQSRAGVDSQRNGRRRGG